MTIWSLVFDRELLGTVRSLVFDHEALGTLRSLVFGLELTRRKVAVHAFTLKNVNRKFHFGGSDDASPVPFNLFLLCKRKHPH